MKKIKFLAPMLSLATLSTASTVLVSCSKTVTIETVGDISLEHDTIDLSRETFQTEVKFTGVDKVLSDLKIKLDGDDFTGSYDVHIYTPEERQTTEYHALLTINDLSLINKKSKVQFIPTLSDIEVVGPEIKTFNGDDDFESPETIDSMKNFATLDGFTAYQGLDYITNASVTAECIDTKSPLGKIKAEFVNITGDEDITSFGIKLEFSEKVIDAGKYGIRIIIDVGGSEVWRSEAYNVTYLPKLKVYGTYQGNTTEWGTNGFDNTDLHFSGLEYYSTKSSLNFYWIHKWSGNLFFKFWDKDTSAEEVSGDNAEDVLPFITSYFAAEIFANTYMTQKIGTKFIYELSMDFTTLIPITGGYSGDDRIGIFTEWDDGWKLGDIKQHALLDPTIGTFTGSY